MSDRVWAETGAAAAAAAPAAETATPAGVGAGWSILAVTTFGAFVANLDATIVVVALPTILTGLRTSIAAVLWTMTAYLLVSTVLLLPLGWLSDRMGRSRLFLAGFLLFALGSALSGAAPSGAWLIAFRCVQGLGGALISGLGTPIITESFPRDRLGLALGLNSFAWVMGSVVGPVAGGLLVATLGWRSIFYVVVPFSLAAFVVGLRVLPRHRPTQRTDGHPIDLPGVVLFTLALTILLLVFTEGAAWGWLGVRSIVAYTVILAAAAAFLAREGRTPYPLFQLRLFRSHPFAASQALVTFTSIGFFATTFLLTFYLQGGLGRTPLLTGLLLIPLSAPQLLSSPVGGRLADRFGAGRPMLAGVLGMGIGVFWLAHLPDRLAFWSIAGPLTLMAVANGLYWPPLASFVMKAAPRSMLGAASGLFYTLRNVGFSLSLTLALVFAEASLPGDLAVRIFLGVHTRMDPTLALALMHAVRTAFLVFSAAFALGLVAALPIARLGRRDPAVQDA